MQNAARILLERLDEGVSANPHEGLEQDEGATTTRCLLCRVGGRYSGLPLEHVIEVMRPLPVERVAETLGFVRGMSILRGEAVPVVDARRLLGGDEPAPGGRFVALRVGPRRVALHVDEVLGVRVLARELLGEVPPLLGEASAARSALGALDGRLLELLDTALLLPERSVEAGASA